MKSYDLNKLINFYNDFSFRDEIPSEEFKYYFEGHEKIIKPDFFVVLDLKKAEPIIFQKNYNLKFDENSKESIHDILNAIDPEQMAGIFEIDKKCLEFGEANILLAKQVLFQLRFTASLIEGQPRTFLRSILFLNINHVEAYQPILFVHITDITDFAGVKDKAKFGIKYMNDDDDLSEKLQNFKNEINSVLNPKVNITNRERQILDLIATGITSQEISKHLEISVKTVNTHRQNLIRKFKVQNTTALIKMLSD